MANLLPSQTQPSKKRCDRNVNKYQNKSKSVVRTNKNGTFRWMGRRGDSKEQEGVSNVSKWFGDGKRFW